MFFFYFGRYNLTTDFKYKQLLIYAEMYILICRF